MPQKITLEIADDGTVSVSVEMDGGAPQMMAFEAVEEALDAIEDLVGAEEESPEAMWNAEATAREKAATEEEMM
jgi:hypothetical protein